MRHQTTLTHLCPHQSVHTYSCEMPLYVQDQCIHTPARCHCTYNFPAELFRPASSISLARHLIILGIIGPAVGPSAHRPSSINDLACGVHLRSLRDFFLRAPTLHQSAPAQTFPPTLLLYIYIQPCSHFRSPPSAHPSFYLLVAPRLSLSLFSQEQKVGPASRAASRQVAALSGFEHGELCPVLRFLLPLRTDHRLLLLPQYVVLELTLRPLRARAASRLYYLRLARC